MSWASPPEEERSTLDCLRVILDEEWAHHGFAERDLAVLEGPRTASAVSVSPQAARIEGTARATTSSTDAEAIGSTWMT